MPRWIARAVAVSAAACCFMASQQRSCLATNANPMLAGGAPTQPTQEAHSSTPTTDHNGLPTLEDLGLGPDELQGLIQNILQAVGTEGATQIGGRSGGSDNSVPDLLPSAGEQPSQPHDAGSWNDLEMLQRRLQLLAKLGDEMPEQSMEAQSHGRSSSSPHTSEKQEQAQGSQGDPEFAAAEEAFQRLLHSPNIPKYGRGKYIPPPPPPPSIEVLEAMRRGDAASVGSHVGQSMGAPPPRAAFDGGSGRKILSAPPPPAFGLAGDSPTKARPGIPTPGVPPVSNYQPQSTPGSGVARPPQPTERRIASPTAEVPVAADAEMREFLEFQEFKRWKRKMQNGAAAPVDQVEVSADGRVVADVASQPASASANIAERQGTHSAEYLASLQRKIQELEAALADAR